MKRTYLDVRFDVTDLNDKERGALCASVVVQHEAGDDYPDVPSPEIEWNEVDDES